MTRAEFDNAVRAAGAILSTNELLVIGSQALHASVPGTLPVEAARSVEVDIGALRDPTSEMADLIDGSIGEASMFHGTFGYYAKGIDETTAVLPRGWRDRLLRFERPATNGVVAWCLEPHDLWVSKMVAGRPKDLLLEVPEDEMDSVRQVVVEHMERLWNSRCRWWLRE